MQRVLPRTLLGRTILVLIVTVAVAEIATQLVFRQFVVEQYSRSSLRLGTNHIVSMAMAMRRLPPDQRQAYADSVSEGTGLHIYPAAGHEEPPTDSTEVLPERLERLAERLTERLGSVIHIRIADNRDPPQVWIRLPIGEDIWYVSFERNQFDRAFPLSAALLLVTSLCLAVAVAWLTVRRINRPLREVQRNILALSVGADLPYPPTTAGPKEITDLSRAVDRTARALRSSERERALLLAGVSHDLRTPLARIRLAIEMAPQDTPEEAQAMVQDLEDIDRIIDQFLDFARNPEVCVLVAGDLSDVARDCGLRAAAHIDGFSMQLAPELPVALRRPALDRLVGNLLENARRYGRAPIELRTERDGDQAVLSVLDRGPGIPPDQVARLLQPFTRLDASRTGPGGSGLGLAIVDRIARAHGATFQLLAREGGGLEARVSLPLDRSHESAPAQALAVATRVYSTEGLKDSSSLVKRSLRTPAAE